MKTDSIIPFHGHNLPGVVGVLIGLGLLSLALKAENRTIRFVLVLVAAALFAGAGWWFTHIRS